MADQKVEIGERVIASGGDRIYPKGMPVGTVSSVVPDRETGTFLVIKVKPAADLNRLEEVLVITSMTEQAPATAENQSHVRAADILAQRLPTVPKTDQQSPASKTPATAETGAPKKKPAATTTTATQNTTTANGKPAEGGTTPKPPKPKPEKPATQPESQQGDESKPATPPAEPSAGEQKSAQPPSTTEKPPR
jgi:rod shape-determining protein MreC